MPKETILDSRYLVYAAYVDNTLVYIGSGLEGRQNHCTSGCSHVVELNHSQGQGKEIRVEVLRDELSRGVSLVVERELIKKFLPAYNKTHNAYNSKDNIKRKSNSNS